MPVGNRVQRQTDEQRKADAEHGYLFSRIPNNRAGRKFIENLRRYVNRSNVGDINVYANGPRAKAKAISRAEAPTYKSPYDGRVYERRYGSYDSNLPHRFASSFRVYFRRTKKEWAERARAYGLERENEKLVADLDQAASRSALLETVRDRLSLELNEARAQMQGHIADANALRGQKDALAEALSEARAVAERYQRNAEANAERARELQRQLNQIPAWIITVLGWVRETTGDLFVGRQS